MKFALQNGLKMKIVFEEDLSIGDTGEDKNYMFGSNIIFNTDKDGNFTSPISIILESRNMIQRATISSLSVERGKVQEVPESLGGEI